MEYVAQKDIFSQSAFMSNKNVVAALLSGYSIKATCNIINTCISEIATVLNIGLKSNCSNHTFVVLDSFSHKRHIKRNVMFIAGHNS